MSVDPLNPERKSRETIDTLNALRASLSALGYASTPTKAEATVRVEIVGQRVSGQGATALPADARGRSEGVALIRVTVTDGTHIQEIRGRNEGNTDMVKSAADRTARLVQRWANEVGAVTTPGPAVDLPPPATVAEPNELLAHMRTYVRAYEKALAGIVAEERYQQLFSQRAGAYPAPLHVTRRELESQIGFAWFPEPGTWFGFRDVLEVDGKAIPDRQARLEELFVERKLPSDEQLSRVAAASARFNLGPIKRNFNIPTMALLVASEENAERCSFELHDYDVVDGVRVAIVAFTETASPTFITREGRDWPSRGLLWMEPDTGRIRRTDFHLPGDEMEVRLTTWFTDDERLGLLVPLRMREMYDAPRRDDVDIEATADYTNFRTFRAETSGRPGRPW